MNVLWPLSKLLVLWSRVALDRFVGVYVNSSIGIQGRKTANHSISSHFDSKFGINEFEALARIQVGVKRSQQIIRGLSVLEPLYP